MLSNSEKGHQFTWNWWPSARVIGVLGGPDEPGGVPLRNGRSNLYRRCQEGKRRGVVDAAEGNEAGVVGSAAEGKVVAKDTDRGKEFRSSSHHASYERGSLHDFRWKPTDRQMHNATQVTQVRFVPFG